MRGEGWALVGWLLVALAAGAVGGLSAPPGPWYAALDKPPWTPPSWLFGPVWTALYLMMGLAAWLVWRERATIPVAVPLGLFALQLGLNALWSWIFFGWRELGWALAELVVLWVAILTTLVAFWRVRPLAGGLLVPYLAWVTFAGVLNAAIWLRNRG